MKAKLTGYNQDEGYMLSAKVLARVDRKTHILSLEDHAIRLGSALGTDTKRGNHHGEFTGYWIMPSGRHQHSVPIESMGTTHDLSDQAIELLSAFATGDKRWKHRGKTHGLFGLGHRADISNRC